MSDFLAFLKKGERGPAIAFLSQADPRNKICKMLRAYRTNHLKNALILLRISSRDRCCGAKNYSGKVANAEAGISASSNSTYLAINPRSL